MAAHEVLKLTQDPIAFAVFEIRFEGRSSGMADLLPGMLYSKLSGIFPNIGQTQAAEIPLAIRQQMPDWEFAATKQMSGNGININFGQRALNVEIFRPYPGWTTFREKIAQVLEAVFATDLISRIDRYSLRYANIFSPQFLRNIGELNLEVKLNGDKVSETGFQLRSEMDHSSFRVIVTMATGANLTVTNSGIPHPLTGTAVDVDVLGLADASSFMDNYMNCLEALHQTEKKVFFGLLSEVVLQRMGPEFDRGQK